ncbi:MAG: beta-ribofuranosylaminobenzene 5'-phosphate synthase family protein [Promethearchaeota archaeon]
MHFLIRAPARIHMTLIDLNGSVERIDGGLGFGIQEPFFKVEFWDDIPNNNHLSKDFKSPLNKKYAIKIGEKRVNFYGNQNEKEIFEDIIHRMRSKYNLLPKEFSVHIHKRIPPHQGFGSKTQLLLTFAKGIAELYGITPSVYELTRIVGRGGTSGIGYQVFEQGGFHFDLGHSFGKMKEKQSFLPSSASSARPGLPFFHCDLPSNWKIFIMHPQISQKIADQKEISIFSDFTPIAQRDIEIISHRILFQIIPGLLQQDLKVLADGMHTINNHGFKKIEISLQPSFVPDLLNKIYEEFHIPAGLSSFGPILYVIVDNSMRIQDFTNFIHKFNQNDSSIPKINLFETFPNNQGALISHIP